MKKTDKIIYYVVTGLFSAHMLMTVGMYVFNYEMVSGVFGKLGFPAALIYPLAIAKVLGLLAIWTNRSRLLKELAYAGFAIDLVFAAVAHSIADDGGVLPPILILIMVGISFFYHRRLFGSQKFR
ncbi:MAG: DoxX family protein [Bacteroidota bacterium]